MWQHRWALWSGFLGASASCLIKLGVSYSDEHSPIQYFQTQICDQTPWLANLDDTILKHVYRVLGDLMIKRRINLMPYWRDFRQQVAEKIMLRLHLFEVDYCQAITLPVRLMCIIGMIVLNAYMIASFLKGMKESGSVVATSLSTAANFTASAVYGALVWKERMNLQWCFGFASVLLGVVILSNVQSADDRSIQDVTKNGGRNREKNARAFIRHKMQQNNTETAASTNAMSPLRASAKHKIKTSPPTIAKGKVASLRSVFANDTGSPSPNHNNNDASVTSPQTAASAGVATPLSTTSSRKSWSVPITPSPRQSLTPTSVNTGPMSPERVVAIKNKRSKLKHESALEQYYHTSEMATDNKSNNALVDRGFLNECVLCEEKMFDNESTGESVDDGAAIADLSPNTCFHIFHAKCLKQTSKGFGNACPICEKPLAMWITAKQAAHFPGFWLNRVEKFLASMDKSPHNESSGNPTCLPASVIREFFEQDSSLTSTQKRYIHDDPTGAGKGLKACLEWGGYRDYNTVPKGHVGFSDCLRTLGVWKYDPKKDDIWLWKWGPIHPRQRCDQCQLAKRPLPVKCEGCQGSAEAAFYCSEACSKRDWQRHRQTCQKWQDRGPPSVK